MTRRSHASGGFTLVELVAVLIVTAILAGVAVPALGTLASSRHAAAARDFARGVTQARQRAIATGVCAWVVVDPDAETWSVLIENPLTPGRASATALTDPATGRPLIVQLGTGALAQTGIVAADFDSGVEVGFDWLGRPLNAGETPLAAQGVVTLSGGHLVNIEPDTGHVSHVSP